VIIRSKSNRLLHVQQNAEACLAAIQSIPAGQILRLG
jgi:hypothetical protein